MNKMNQIEQIKALYNITTKYLVNDDEMADCGWDELSRLELLGICIDYVEKFGGMDFIAYVEYCEEKDVTDRISTTLAHDLNGMNQECFLPRTSGYYEKEERNGRIRGIKQTPDSWTLDINEGSK